MSADFYVAVHAADWPTMQALQKCIEERGWPVKIGAHDDPNWTQPFEAVPMTAGLPVTFNGEPLDLEASFVTLSPTQSYAYTFDRPPDRSEGGKSTYVVRPDELWKPVDINETLTEIGAAGVRFEHGDHVLTLSFRSEAKNWQAGFYVMAGLIKCFGGYGFDAGGAHGTSDYADTLLKEAEAMASEAQ